MTNARSKAITIATRWVYLAFIVLTGTPAVIWLIAGSHASWYVDSLAIATMIVAGFGLYRSAMRTDFTISWCVFWLWTFIFMTLAPAYQLGHNSFPWRGRFTDATLATSFAIILAGVAAAAVTEYVTNEGKRRRQLAMIGREPRAEAERRMLITLTALLAGYLVCVAIFVIITGPALFEGKALFRERLIANTPVIGAGTLFFIATAGAIIFPAVAIVARRNGLRIPITLVLLTSIAGFVVTNPLTGSRFLTGSYVVALVGALVIGRPVARLLPAAVGLGLITVFPSLDLLRGDGTGSKAIALTMPWDALIKFDFDAFELLTRAVTVAGDLPPGSPSPATLLIAPFLRWVPVLSKLVTGDATGHVVGQATHMSYTNVSMPLWGEGFVIGGFLSVVVIFIALGIALGLVRTAAQQPIVAVRHTNLIIDAPVSALLFIVLRGSLYEVLGYLLLAFAVGAALSITLSVHLPPRTAADAKRPRTIAFYLPQFHTIPQNDEWWGDGFTDWTNVLRARPQFAGHDHPRRSTELTEYDLTDIRVMHEQAALARAHDVDAFCFYFYWFGGARLLERPIDQYISDGPDFPFCISWANESWTRRWDGKANEALITQEYTAQTPEEVFNAFLPYLRDDRYLRVEGAAVLLVHRADHLPDGKHHTSEWKRLADAAGVGPLRVIAAETNPGITPASVGFDAVAEFPPVGANTLSAARLTPPAALDRTFRGRLMSYRRLANRYMRRDVPGFARYRGLVPGWDNTARRGSDATIYLDPSPARYHDWLTHARVFEQRARGEKGLVFVNAWNEWAEGAHLEPDRTNGRDFLEATKWSAQLPIGGKRTSHSPGLPTYPWWHSMALATAGSFLQAGRRIRSHLTR